MIDIQPVQEHDLTAIYDVQCRAFKEELHEPVELFAEMLSHYPEGCFVFRYEGEVIGYIFTHPSSDDRDDYETAGWHQRGGEDCLFIHDLCLDPAYHGRGIAQMVLNYVEAFARDRGFRALIGTAVEGVEKFWEKQGFTMLRPYDYSGVKATFMEKKLAR